MLLLLLIGAGIATPTVDGVRAYATTTFSAATGAATGITSITLAQTGTSPRTNAETTEE